MRVLAHFPLTPNLGQKVLTSAKRDASPKSGRPLQNPAGMYGAGHLAAHVNSLLLGCWDGTFSGVVGVVVAAVSENHTPDSFLQQHKVILEQHKVLSKPQAPHIDPSVPVGVFASAKYLSPSGVFGHCPFQAFSVV
jgi:hypothetical protein